MDEKEVRTEIAEVKEEPKELAPAPSAPTLINWFDSKAVGAVYKVAQLLSTSGLLPERYKGKPADVMIAMDLASRMNLSLVNVCQDLYVVQGNPGWSGKFCISAIENCGRYSPLEFVWFDEETGGCLAQARDLRTGKLCQSAPITNQTVKDFGWDAKANSMWNKAGMRQQMFMYRAAAYFARTFCPDVLSGMYTTEEIHDIKQSYTVVEG